MAIFYIACRQMTNGYLPIDQIIQEYGEYGEYGRPDWVHIGMAKFGARPRNQVLIKAKGTPYRQLPMKEVLKMIIDQAF